MGGAREQPRDPRAAWHKEMTHVAGRGNVCCMLGRNELLSTCRAWPNAGDISVRGEGKKSSRPGGAESGQTWAYWWAKVWAINEGRKWVNLMVMRLG